MDFGKAFTYLFDDEEWVTKLLIGGIVAFIPIVNLAVIGYAVKVLKNVADGVERPLPAWSDFGDFFVKGLIGFLGALLWALPIIVVSGLSMMLSFALYDTSAEYGGLLDVCLWGLNCLSGLYGLFLAIVLPAAFANYAISNEFGALFRFGQIVKYITSNLGNYVIAILLGWVAQFIAGFGVILCLIGVIFTQFWASLVNAHLLGQVCRLSEIPSPEPAA